jgi:hypothetical protein
MTRSQSPSKCEGCCERVTPSRFKHSGITIGYMAFRKMFLGSAIHGQARAAGRTT